jgi:hypothetical protein
MDNLAINLAQNSMNPSTQSPSFSPAHLGGSGPYVFRTKLSNRCLDISQTNDWGNHSGDLIIYDYVGGTNQQFNLIPEGDYVLIQCVRTSKVLDAYHQGEYPESMKEVRVRENMYNGGYGQKWKFVEVKPGSEEYYIYTADGKVMDVCGEKGSNNNFVIPYNFHGKNNQIWTITPASMVKK